VTPELPFGLTPKLPLTLTPELPFALTPRLLFGPQPCNPLSLGCEPKARVATQMEKGTWILRKAPDCASFKMAKVTNGKDLDGTSRSSTFHQIRWS